MSVAALHKLMSETTYLRRCLVYGSPTTSDTDPNYMSEAMSNIRIPNTCLRRYPIHGSQTYLSAAAQTSYITRHTVTSLGTQSHHSAHTHPTLTSFGTQHTHTVTYSPAHNTTHSTQHI
ncbi:hypothetical protein B0T26DRAFT_730486 [Lasiosphaeria miniovina]|uniref:Uncharacterized protein n=1 Tax=Lasiosphaeria miniovina TaxID=1954250 RepID=A0AA40DJ53_9PEZI|nr:uncharacterized protein B0T26DRAFT_730486 [Lasiosphaeria miniovina]KAK0703251.1 hypothetical protein B0T26DRAFT_730486 [Lasiosphaeria miniovina]